MDSKNGLGFPSESQVILEAITNLRGKGLRREKEVGKKDPHDFKINMVESGVCEIFELRLGSGIFCGNLELGGRPFGDGG